MSFRPRSIRDWPAYAWSVVYGAMQWFIAGRGTRDGAQMSFYLLLSLPALLLVVVWFLSGVLDEPDVRTELVNEIMRVLPLEDTTGRQQVESLLNDIAAGAGGLGIIGLIGLVYAISGGVSSLRYAIETAGNVARKRSYEDSFHRPFVRGRPLDLLVTLIVIPAALVVAYISVGTPVFADLQEDLPVIGRVSIAVRWALPIALGLIVFTVAMRALSPAAARLGWIASFVGAAVAVLALVLVVVGLQIYFGIYTGKSSVYGAIAGILTVAFTVNVASWVIIYGVYVATRLNEDLLGGTFGHAARD